MTWWNVLESSMACKSAWLSCLKISGSLYLQKLLITPLLNLYNVVVYLQMTELIITVDYVLSDHPRGLEGVPLNSGWPLNTGSTD